MSGAVQTVQTTGVNLEGVLANAAVIVGALAGVLRVCWHRVKRQLREEATEFMKPTVDAVEGLTGSMVELRGRMEQLESQRAIRDKR